MAMSLWPHFFGPPWENKTRNGQIVVDKAPWWREFWRWFPASGCWWWPRRGARPSADHPGCCEYTTSPCSTSTPHCPTYNNDIAGSAPGPVLPLVGCGCWWWPHHGARPSTDHPGCCEYTTSPCSNCTPHWPTFIQPQHWPCIWTVVHKNIIR